MNNDKILNNWWSKVKDVSPEKVVQELREHWDKFRNTPQLKKAWSQITLMFQLLRDSLKGEYPDFPKSKMLLIAGALAYMLLPLDLVPDFIPVVGWLDDVVVLTWVFAQCQPDLDLYKTWRQRTGRDSAEVKPAADASTIDVPCND